MNVSQLMTHVVHTARPLESLSDAAQRMWDGDLGSLPVVADDGSDRLLGVITDRDICMCAYTRGLALKEIPVEAAMSREPITCRPEDSVEDAALTMARAMVRRLPVVAASNRLAGILSLADVAQRASSLAPGVRRVELAGVGATFADVTRPRTNHAAQSEIERVV